MRYLLLTLFAFLLTACSPKYEIKTLYTLPTDTQGRSCVQTCSTERKLCQAHCNQKQDVCLIEAKQNAQNAYPELMREYQDVLAQYNDAMNQYESEFSTWKREERRVHQDFNHYQESCSHGPQNSYECRRAGELDAALQSLEEHQPQAVERPIKPSLNGEIKKEQQYCSNECGCTKDYDNCFVSCGGQLQYKKFCIENCEK